MWCDSILPSLLFPIPVAPSSSPASKISCLFSFLALTCALIILSKTTLYRIHYAKTCAGVPNLNILFWQQGMGFFWCSTYRLLERASSQMVPKAQYRNDNKCFWLPHCLGCYTTFIKSSLSKPGSRKPVHLPQHFQREQHRDRIKRELHSPTAGRRICLETNCDTTAEELSSVCVRAHRLPVLS